MSTIVITGANRGIGLALATRYAEDGDTVFGLCRSPGKAADLRALADRTEGRVRIGAIDIADAGSIAAAAKAVAEPIDVLVNNAGILGGEDQSLDGVDLDEWLRCFKVMAIGPFLVTRAFLPQLERAHGKAIFVSSQVAASTWPYGGFYAYATAKAAGTRLAQVLAIDLEAKGVVTASVHPGYVQTDMGGPNADITPEESAAGIVKLVAGLGPADSGGFFKWNGEPHPL